MGRGHGPKAAAVGRAGGKRAGQALLVPGLLPGRQDRGGQGRAGHLSVGCRDRKRCCCAFSEYAALASPWPSHRTARCSPLWTAHLCVSGTWRPGKRYLPGCPPGHEGTITSVAYAPDGRTLISMAEDHTVRWWDTSIGRQRLSLPATEALSWPQGNRLVREGPRVRAFPGRNDVGRHRCRTFGRKALREGSRQACVPTSASWMPRRAKNTAAWRAAMG